MTWLVRTSRLQLGATLLRQQLDALFFEPRAGALGGTLLLERVPALLVISLGVAELIAEAAEGSAPPDCPVEPALEARIGHRLDERFQVAVALPRISFWEGHIARVDGSVDRVGQQ